MSTAIALRTLKPAATNHEYERPTISALRTLPDAPPSARKIPEYVLLFERIDRLPDGERAALLSLCLSAFVGFFDEGSPAQQIAHKHGRVAAGALEDLVDCDLWAKVIALNGPFEKAAAFHFDGVGRRTA